MSNMKPAGYLNKFTGMIWNPEQQPGAESEPEIYEPLVRLSDVHGLVALAEERREFIVNGVEHDYIELPLFEDDRANAIYQRCLLNDGYATADINAELRAQGVDEFASSIGAEASGLSISSNAYKAIKSTVFRAVNFAANLRTRRKG